MVANQTVKFLAKETGGRAAQTVSLKVNKWRTLGAAEGDDVTLMNLPGSTNNHHSHWQWRSIYK